MVQCQRTRFYLSKPAEDGRTFVCDRCPGHETYRRAERGDQPHDVVGLATATCRVEFSGPDDGYPTVVWLGEESETVFEKDLGAYHVYLGRDATPVQALYQAAHESFHRVCTPTGSFHWAHEMLAVHFSLLFLDRVGQHAYAATTRARLTSEAAQCSLDRMLDLAGLPYPLGLYGRAYVVGSELVEAVGWDRSRLLALVRSGAGRPCVNTWLGSLATPERTQAERVLGR